MIGIAAAVALAASATISCGSERDFANPDGSEGGAAADGTGAAAATGGTTDTGSGGKGGDTNSSADPQACREDSDCVVSEKCRISFEDKDEDGYGNDAATTGRCDGSIPAGYTALGGDCCDDGGNLEVATLINPGQETYFDTPANICGISWDYDCSEEVEFGGYTCSNSDEACADPKSRDYDSAAATETSYSTGCVTALESCGDGCEDEMVELSESDCGAHYPVISCGCNVSCGSGGCTACGVGASSRRRVVECH